MFDGLFQAIGLIALMLLGAGAWAFLHLKRRLEHWRHYGVAASINRIPGRVFLLRRSRLRNRELDVYHQ